MSGFALRLAGWVAAISAVLTVPLFALQVLAARAGPSLLSVVLQVVNAALLLYVLGSLRALLARRGITAANAYLAAIIAITVILQLIALVAASGETLMTLLIFGGLVALGVFYIAVGIKLLAHTEALPGLKLLSYAAIAVGTCTASIVLALLALPASMVLDVALAIIFFREAGNPAPAA